MTARERVLSVYRNRVPDQMPVSLYSFFVRYGTVQRTARNNGLAILDIANGASLLAPPFFVRPDCLSEVKGGSFSVDYKWVEGELIEVHTYQTRVGTISEHVARDPLYGSNWRRKHYIEKLDDYRVVQYVVENTVFRHQKDSIAQRKRDLSEDGVVLCRLDRSPYQKLLIELAGPERFLVDLHTDPSPVTELMQVIDYRLDDQVAMALDSEADAMWIPENITSDMTPPAAFQRYCLPFYERTCRRCREAGKPTLVHIDGKIRALRDLVATAPFEVIDSLSLPEMNGDISISEAKKAWPDKVICPNFPSSLSTCSVERIEAFLESVFQDFGEHTPFMLQISEDIPLQSYQHLLPALTSFVKRRSSAA